MTITEFLLARIEEDEAAAKASLEPVNLHPYGDVRIPAIKPEEWGSLVDNYLGGPMGKHCARHDPTRVLAECEAKRAIVDGVLQMERDRQSMLFEPLVRWHYKHTLQWFIRPFAAVYKDHPDYRQEWAA